MLSNLAKYERYLVDCNANSGSRRYVVDFYNAQPLSGMPIAMHLDVRPALDSPTALLDRIRMQYRWMNSGRWKGQRVASQPHQEPQTTS